MIEFSTRRGWALLCAIVVLITPGIAAACSVCMTGREDETRVAFELMTAFMTVIPFVIVGGVFWWLRGRLKELEAMHERARRVGEEAFAAASGNTASRLESDPDRRRHAPRRAARG